jgi:hypothetical protein
MSYQDFLETKRHLSDGGGFEPIEMPSALLDFQEFATAWALRKGRAALFFDCGLGKTLMQLAWADNVARKTNRRVLVLTPLAVASQTIREGEKFGIECYRSAGELRQGAEVVVANYEKLHHFNPADFAGVVCDESSILKNFDGKRRGQITEFLRTLEYRLLATATAAPNDYTELGTSSEALGGLGLYDMLGRFFKNDQNNVSTKRGWALQGGEPSGPKWRFKGHAEGQFWRWVCSWARACRKPSDLGFEDRDFALPELIERDHIVQAAMLAPGMLFAMPARGLSEEREERRRTITERCDKAAELVDHDRPAVIWCHLNDEGNRLAKIIPGAVQVRGADSDEEKERAYEAFASGETRVLVIKPKIGAFGLNWQHCAHVVSFASHSYEQDYQAVRRCWRFGQRSPVTVDRIFSEGEASIRANLARKSEAASRMFSELVAHMNHAIRLNSGRTFNEEPEVPPWLSTINS